MKVTFIYLSILKSEEKAKNSWSYAEKKKTLFQYLFFFEKEFNLFSN